jgi:hypothetical protein
MEKQDTGPLLPRTRTVGVLACPKCGAPADIDSLTENLSRPIRCLFCDTVYTLQQSQDDAQQREQNLKLWVEQKIAGISPTGASGIDVDTRSFLFNKDFYPDLKRDVDRRLEDLENVPETQMIPCKALTGLHDYQPNYLLITIGQGDNEWLKTLSTRLSAQQVQDFATTGKDQYCLKTLQFRVRSLIYYANIACLLDGEKPSSFHVIRQNIQALQKEYQTFASEVMDQSHRSYLAALNSRLACALVLLDILIPLLGEGRSFTPEAVLAQLERSLSQYAKADQQASACTYNFLYTVPLQQGIQKDMMITQIISAIVKCYQFMQNSTQLGFLTFYDQILHYVHSLVPVQSFAQLSGLVDSLRDLLAARSGETPLPVINEWSWLQAAINGNKHKSNFFSYETVGTVINHLHPYWIAELLYTEKQGMISKSGKVCTGFILADATSVGTPIVGCLLANDPLLPVINQGVNTYNLLDKQLTALPALVSSDRAEQMMKQYASQHAAELGATNVKIKSLIYLPVAFVQYLGKNQRREAFIGRLSFVNQNLSNMLHKTYQFLYQCGV